MQKIIVAAGLAALISGCGQADKEKSEKLQQEVTKLQAEVGSLRAELEAERNGPHRLLARGKNEFGASGLGIAKETLSELVARFPESEQAQEAKKLLSEINEKIVAAEKAKQLEAQKAAEEQRKALARLDANLVKNVDEIKGITWVSHKSVPLLENYMTLYFGVKDGSAASYPLRMKLNYHAESWLFIESVTIKADDKVFDLGKLDFERDNAAGSIWEWSDTRVEDMAMLNSILSAKKVVIRYDGRQYYHDFVLPDSQKNAMKESLLAWQRYGGKA